MSAGRIATRYAKSLLDLSIERGKLEDVLQDIKLLNTVIAMNRDFEVMLKSPIIHSDKKEGIINAVFTDKLNRISVEFLDILIRKRREAYLPEITRAFIAQYNSHHRITPLKITTAIELDEALKSQLVEKIKQTADIENVELKAQVDEELLGGFVIQYEDKLYDASVLRNLKLMKKEFEKNTYVKKF
jgi:F-type H+-transporting ATPase subunit delta